MGTNALYFAAQGIESLVGAIGISTEACYDLGKA